MNAPGGAGLRVPPRRRQMFGVAQPGSFAQPRQRRAGGRGSQREALAQRAR